MADRSTPVRPGDDSIPIISLTESKNRTPSPGRRAHLRSKSQELSSRVGNKMMQKLESMDSKRSGSENPSSMQDRLLNMYVYFRCFLISHFAQVIHIHIHPIVVRDHAMLYCKRLYSKASHLKSPLVIEHFHRHYRIYHEPALFLFFDLRIYHVSVITHPHQLHFLAASCKRI